MSTDERRALGLIAALLVLTGAARWLERPRPVLEDVPALDLAAMEAASRRDEDAASPAGPVDVNTASPAELDRLPGVGPALAQRIVDGRPYASLEDLGRVSGVGMAMLERLAPRVTLKPAARGRQTGSGTGAQVYLNAATVGELARVKGIGAALAARLVARRDSLGRFDSWDQVDAVSGVGPAMLARMQREMVLQP